MSRRLVPSRKSIRISLPPPARHIPLALYAVNMNTVKSKIKRDIHATMAPERSYELGLETETGAPTKSESVSVERFDMYQLCQFVIVKGTTNPVIDGGSGWHPIVYTTPVWFPVPDHCSKQFSGPGVAWL